MRGCSLRRLLLTGSGKVSTGFGRAIHCLANELCRELDVHVLAHDVFDAPTHIGPWMLHPGSPRDIFAVNRLSQQVDQLRPEWLLIFNDYWFLPGFLSGLQRAHHRPRVVLYTPVDARPTTRRSIDLLRSIDGLAVYTEYAKRILLAPFVGEAAPPPFDTLRVLPLGTSIELFQPLAGGAVGQDRSAARRKARRALLGEDDPRVEGLWLLSANKNSNRKRLDIAMEGFALFAKDKPPEVRMYLHAGRLDTGPDLARLCRNLGLDERLIFNAMSASHPDVPVETLNLIYNACELGLNTSVGEGWGLVAFEHAATGGAQMLPRHSAILELWDGSADLVDPISSVTFGPNLEGQILSPLDVARHLERLYANPDLLQRLSAAAYANATRPDRNWTNIAEQWLVYLDQL